MPRGEEDGEGWGVDMGRRIHLEWGFERMQLDVCLFCPMVSLAHYWHALPLIERSDHQHS